MTASTRDTRLSNHQTPSFLIDTVHLDFDLADKFTHVTSKLAIRRHPEAADSVTDLVLDGDELILESIWLNDTKLTSEQYEITAKSLIVYNVPDQFTLLMQTKINPANNIDLSGLYQSRGNFRTQCEADGLRHITYFLNHPDVMAIYTTTITADLSKQPIMLSNGKLIDRGVYSTGRHWVTFEDPFKKPSHLFTLAAGNFELLQDHYTTSSGRKITLKMYSEIGYAAELTDAMISLKSTMASDEEDYGFEYGLDEYKAITPTALNTKAVEKTYQAIDNFHPIPTYYKSAEIFRILQPILGKETFKAGMRQYFKEVNAKVATIKDFMHCMEQASSKDLSQFLLWYQQTTIPNLTIKDGYNASTQTYTLQITQSPDKPMMIPIQIRLLDGGGNLIFCEQNGISTSEIALLLEEHQHTFRFLDISKRPLLSLSPYSSALVTLDYPYSNTALLILANHRKDPLARWKASQAYVMDYLLQLIKDYRRNYALAITGNFINHFRSLLNDNQIDTKLLSQILTMPTEDQIARQMKQIDADAICCVRKFVRGEIAHILREELLSKYHQHKHLNNAADRAIKNVCLGFLIELETDEIIHIVKAQLDAAKASNRVDAAMLHLLANLDCRQRDKALADFYKQWQDDPIVLMQWFIIQASSPFALNKINGLINNPAFDMHNSAMVRALIKSFTLNYSCFHAASGAGYQFLANLIFQLNKQNTTLATDFCKHFSTWKRFKSPQRELMQQTYKKISTYLGKEIKKESVSTVPSTLFNTDDQIGALKIRTSNEKLSVTM